MALSIVKSLLQQYIQSLFEEGVVNDQFARIRDSKTEEEPDCVLQLINTYCSDVKKILLELESYTDFPEVDYLNLEAIVREIEAKSSYFGAELVRLTCADLIQACREGSMRKFVCALCWMKNEFERTRNKLETVGQMERKIIRLERKQKK
ncbi:hypothetical protein M5689_022624 [Euphorbia peplus]|nr:hypothetical protein M5689_022624 [Euphorbia peplus]